MYNNHKVFELVTLLLQVLIIYLFLEIAFSIFDLYYLYKLKENGSVSEGLQIYWNIKSNFFYYCSRLIPITFGLTFIVWFYREYWNLQSLFNQYEFKFQPVMAIIGFVIPIFNFYAPLIIMKEIVEGYKTYYNKNINSVYLNIWWFGYLIYLIYVKIISFMNLVLVDEFINYTYHVIISCSIGVISLIFLKLILRHLTPNIIKNY
jgi:hypothetical protein